MKLGDWKVTVTVSEETWKSLKDEEIESLIDSVEDSLSFAAATIEQDHKELKVIVNP